MIFWIALLCISVFVVIYSYLGYPILVALFSRLRRKVPSPFGSSSLPAISITVPVYNEEAVIRETLDALVSIDYPEELRHILVISDASEDGTDDIVREFRDRGVELLRLEERGGKTAAENAARDHLRGEIVVNTDASVRIPPDAVKPLVAVFEDPSIGVASGRDVSVTKFTSDGNKGESGYVGYEMWLRSLETRLDGIVGASGCFYASRKNLHMEIVPEALSRDFAAPLIAKENGYRSVSVNDALCLVPRVSSLHREYRRKVRTMTRGLETLFYKRSLLNPFKYGMFSWMLLSHKLVRWLVPWSLVLGFVAVAGLAFFSPWAWLMLGPAIALLGLSLVGWSWKSDGAMPTIVSIPAYIVSGTLAGLVSWIQALRGALNPVWEPTRRDTVLQSTPEVRKDD